MKDIVKILRESRHLKTEVDPRKIGDSRAEVCFVGRSNTGKSSLINALCQKKNMAHSSQVPGKTRTINVYEIIPGHWIVDLPGYGFAVGLKHEMDSLGKIIEAYLNSRPKLRMVFVLVDAVAGPTTLDIKMIDWLRHYAFPFTIVVSKIDKIAAPKLEGRKREVAAELSVNSGDLLWVSSRKGLGITDLQHMLGRLLQVLS